MTENRKILGRKMLGLLIVVGGIVLGQAILYGPSLVGRKILLPLDLLAQPGVYMPPTPETANIVPHDRTLTDLVTQFEPARRFAVSEIHHGRIPLWAVYHFAGAPSVWSKYSLFMLLACSTQSPVILAWVQLFAALVVGTGMYFFCRKILRVSFWPSATCAWCYPLTAFFVLWQGHHMVWSVFWLPWIFLLVDKTVRELNSLAPLGLGVVTFLALTSGQIDVAGQVLLSSGIFAVWCLWDAYRERKIHLELWKAIAKLICGWGLGFMLAAPHLIPLVEYARTGSRMVHRGQGAEERPPVGWSALPQVVLPDMYGSFERNSAFLPPVGEANPQESTTASYTGVFATLLVAPLAWCNRQRRPANLFWAFLAFFGLSWCLDVPGIVDLLQLPGLNMMSHNRLVFLTSFAILALTANGLETLLVGSIPRRWWFWLPAVLLAALGGWCVYRCHFLPEPIVTQANFDAYRQGRMGWPMITTDVKQVQAWFIHHYVIMAAFCLIGVFGWLLVWFRKLSCLFPVLVFFLLGDLLRFDYGRSAQCDPNFYYPRIPALEAVAKSIPGRVIGFDCLPASVAMMAGLNDIRGYDGIDPMRMVTLLRGAALPGGIQPYAATQLMLPYEDFTPTGALRLFPILDMLNVRYVVFRGFPPPSIQPAFQSNDYWVAINSNALPRVFVPKSVKMTASDDAELKALATPQFNPADMAYVESSVELPASCRGTAKIENEIPTHITISAQMKTPGMIVLADNWDKGWRAYWNGRPMPVLRANYAVRGVVVPAGNGTLEFIYRPFSLILGLWLAGLAIIVLAGWLVAIKIQTAKTTAPPWSGHEPDMGAG